MARPRKPDDDAGEPAPRPSRGFKADPALVLHPQARVEPHQLIAGRVFGSAGAELRPPVLRRGALDASRIPSRMGNRLVQPDGEITHLANAAPHAVAMPPPSPALMQDTPAPQRAARPPKPPRQPATRGRTAAPAPDRPWHHSGWPFTST